MAVLPIRPLRLLLLGGPRRTPKCCTANRGPRTQRREGIMHLAGTYPNKATLGAKTRERNKPKAKKQGPSYASCRDSPDGSARGSTWLVLDAQGNASDMTISTATPRSRTPSKGD